MQCARVTAAAALLGELLDPHSGGVEQLLDDAVDRLGDLVTLGRVEVREAPREPGEFGGDDVLGAPTQGTHRGGDRLGAAHREVLGDLRRDQVSRGLHLRVMACIAQQGAQVGQVEESDAGNRRGTGFDIARQGEVDDDQGPTLTAPLGLDQVGGGDHEAACTGAGDHHVGAAERSLPILPGDHLAAQSLGLARDWPVAIIGMGNLGRALAAYRGFATRGFKVVAVLDHDERLVGLRAAGLVVQAMADLPALVREQGLAIGVIATPPESAQDVADQLVAAGVRSILNFAPVVLSVPGGVDVRKVDLGTELQILAFLAQQRTVPTTRTAEVS